MNQSQRLRTNEQIAREFEVLKEIEDERAKERQVEAGKTFGNGKDTEDSKQLVENFPQTKSDNNVTQKNGKSRDIAAKKTNSGKSGKTLENSLQITRYADKIKADHPVLSQHLLDRLNDKSVKLS